MGKPYSIVLFLTLLPFVVTAQEQRDIDSLTELIAEAKHDTTLVAAYVSLSEILYVSNLDTVIPLCSKAREIAERNLAQNPPASLERKYLSLLADALNNIGYIYWGQGAIEEALQFFHKCLKIQEEIGNKSGIANSLNNLGYIYWGQGDAEKSLQFHQKSLSIKEEIGNKGGIANSLNNIGIIYRDQGNFEKALQFFQNCLTINEEMDNKEGIANSLNSIGGIYDDIGDSPKALEYVQKSLIIQEEIRNKKGIARGLANIAELLMKIQDGDPFQYASRSLIVAQEIGSPDHIEQSALLISRIAKKKGEYKEALEMYELHIQMRDSVKNEETQKATIRQQTKYEFEKAQLVKEQEEREAARVATEILSRRDNLQYSIVLICLLFIGVLVAMLGRLSLSERIAEGIIFFSFLILFEFLLVLADPYIEGWSGGAPGIKLLFNAGIAALIFPAHAFFETKLKGRLVKSSM